MTAIGDDAHVRDAGEHLNDPWNTRGYEKRML